MKLNDKKKAEWENTLKEINFISAEDSIQEHTAGDLWTFTSQTRGNFFFTKEKFIFVGGLAGLSNFSVPYNKITGIKKCNVGGIIPIIPTGLKITYTDEDGKSVKKKCSVMKRNNWIDYLTKNGAQND